MTAPTISHVICSMGLIALIFILPMFYSIISTNIENEVVVRELQEIVDYTSNSITNLYLLVNSTDYDGTISLQKELMYLPSRVQDSSYVLELFEDVSDGTISYVSANMTKNPSISAISWIAPGLKLASDSSELEITEIPLVIYCQRNDTGTYVGMNQRN